MIYLKTEENYIHKNICSVFRLSQPLNHRKTGHRLKNIITEKSGFAVFCRNSRIEFRADWITVIVKISKLMDLTVLPNKAWIMKYLHIKNPLLFLILNHLDIVFSLKITKANFYQIVQCNNHDLVHLVIF